MDIADMRQDYRQATLDESQVADEPIVQFDRWFNEAVAAKLYEPNAVCLATATSHGAPSARMVLLKGVDERGFVIYTDYRSRKGAELTANPQAALCFHWAEVERQVRVTGLVERVSREESSAYYHSRPAGSQIGAWSSEQSSVLSSRKELEDHISSVQVRFAKEDVIPLPDHWGGFLIRPLEMEFWQGRSSRLHDRIRYRREGGLWIHERLSP